MMLRLLLLWCVCAPAWAGEVLVDMLDVGQGDAILIQGGGKHVLIDAGDRSANTVAQLKTLGVTQLDAVIATHAHADHIGRMADVLASFQIGIYLDSGVPHTTTTYANTMSVVEHKPIGYKPAIDGLVLRLGDEATLTVLNPPVTKLSGTRSDINSNSVVVRLDHGDNCFLFMGDAEEPTERRLMQNDLQPCDVLKVAHHGSKHSSTQAFIDRVKPSIALISVGVDNRYHHPSEQTITRLQDSGAQVYRTDLSHHLRVISDGSLLEVLEGDLSEVAGLAVVTAPAPPSPRAPTQGPGDLDTPANPCQPADGLHATLPTWQGNEDPKTRRKRERAERRAARKAARLARKEAA